MTSDRTPALVLDAVRAQVFEFVTSPALVAEFRRVLLRPRIASRLIRSSEETEASIREFERVVVFVDPPAILVVVRDPADNRVLEAAVAREADYIVSRD